MNFIRGRSQGINIADSPNPSTVIRKLLTEAPVFRKVPVASGESLRTHVPKGASPMVANLVDCLLLRRKPGPAATARHSQRYATALPGRIATNSVTRRSLSG